MALYMGIDVGGTTVKGIILNDGGKLLAKGHVTTVEGEGLAGCIDMLCEQLVQSAGGVFSQIKCVGVGCPGLIDSENGTVIFAGNATTLTPRLSVKPSSAQARDMTTACW